MVALQEVTAKGASHSPGTRRRPSRCVVCSLFAVCQQLAACLLCMRIEPNLLLSRPYSVGEHRFADAQREPSSHNRKMDGLASTPVHSPSVQLPSEGTAQQTLVEQLAAENKTSMHHNCNNRHYNDMTLLLGVMVTFCGGFMVHNTAQYILVWSTAQYIPMWSPCRMHQFCDIAVLSSNR